MHFWPEQLLVNLLIGYFVGLEHRPIESVVHHYEGLDYSPHHVDHQRRRHKRSLPKDGHRVALDFSAHGRDFKLRLKRDHSVFHNSLVVEDGWGRPKEGYDLSHVYDGRCEGPAGGAAFGSLHDGIFDGQVETRHGTYFIERAHKYFKDDSNDSFHSVIYHERHLRDPFRHSKAGESSQNSKLMLVLSNLRVFYQNESYFPCSLLPS